VVAYHALMLMRGQVLFPIAIGVIGAGCDRPNGVPSAESSSAAPESSARALPIPADLLAEANARIAARQKAVKGWKSVAVPSASAPPCAVAPPAPKLVVTGFRMGTTQARKTMTILPASEIEGAPDPSLPPDIARDLAKVNAAGRGIGPLGWAEIDTTTDEYPFQAGPIAKVFQYEVRKIAMHESTADPKQLRALLAGKELVLVAESQARAEVHKESHTFSGGAMTGTALLWSFDDGAVVCAGTFDAANEAKSFEASPGQVDVLPEEELELLAYRSAVARLRALGGTPADH